MPTLRAASLIDGMELACDATGPDGRVVVGMGAVVDATIVSILLENQIHQVEVTKASFERLTRTTMGSSFRPPSNTRRLMNDPRSTTFLQAGLIRIAHMFSDFRDDPIMRELCRLAINCARKD